LDDRHADRLGEDEEKRIIIKHVRLGKSDAAADPNPATH
jgi:hypothetical protein